MPQPRKMSKCKRCVEQAKLSSTTPNRGGCGESGNQALDTRAGCICGRHMSYVVCRAGTSHVAYGPCLPSTTLWLMYLRDVRIPAA
jgi:hypothetical protein